MKASNKAVTKGDIAIGIVKAALLAAVLTLGCIVLYAWTLQRAWLPDSSIPIVNAIIKVVGAGFAAFIATRRCERRRWLIGGVAGVSYVVLAFVVFSIAADSFSLSVALLTDLLMGAVAGMLAAMLLGMRK